MSIFDKLFILEMANNHSGSVAHGKKIIREMKEATKEFSDYKFAVKFQYRDLDTFIHPDYQGRMDIKYIKRFSETRLNESEFKEMLAEVHDQGMISLCTPFDELSVEKVVDHGYQMIKIGSCSFSDWPLLEKVVQYDKPIIISTAGTTFEEIDNVVTFFQHRDKEFCIMHCIGAYPTPNDQLNLNQIDMLKKRYANVPIGFSTHEDPHNFLPVGLAVAKGAVAFERHVGVEDGEIKLNAYSSNPQQVNEWVSAANSAFATCGVVGERQPISEKEINDLRGLKRGVFLKNPVKKGEKIKKEDLYFAIPNQPDQIVANELSKYMELTAEKNIDANQPVFYQDCEVKNSRENVMGIIKQVRDLLIESKIVLPNKIDLEISHHYGLERYNEYGCVILNCINREYCKKLLVVLPGQKHPGHKHIKKEETFQVLYGDLDLTLDGKELHLKAGDIQTIERNTPHSFSTKAGCVFEEISTTHYKNDSFYEDEDVQNNNERKTHMTFWSDWLYSQVS